MKVYHFLFLTLLLFSTVSKLPAALMHSKIPEGVYRYQKMSGEEKGDFLWTLRYYPEFAEIIVHDQETTMINRCEGDGKTLYWEVQDGSGGTTIARRSGNSLTVQMQNSESSQEQTYQLDQRPWFQPFSYSLRPFLISEAQSISFWTIRQDKMKPVVLEATKQSFETLLLQGSEIEAIKVEVRLTGFFAPFWRGTYWYRSSDGLFLKYEGMVSIQDRAEIELVEQIAGR